MHIMCPVFLSNVLKFAEYCMKIDGDEKARCMTTLARLEKQHQRALDMVAAQEEAARSQVRT